MHDWLKEHYPELPSVSSRTVFNYVSRVRQKYQIVKAEGLRVYEMVPERPYRAQGQVGFGLYNMRKTQGSRVKVYFFTLELTRSRYKYVFFSQEPFTTATSIEDHEHAFDFLEGIPDIPVYDQDSLFIVDENNASHRIELKGESLRKKRQIYHSKQTAIDS